jgi:hypothetical protein
MQKEIRARLDSLPDPEDLSGQLPSYLHRRKKEKIRAVEQTSRYEKSSAAEGLGITLIKVLDRFAFVEDKHSRSPQDDIEQE